MFKAYLLVMLAMKKPGKSVNFEHIREKVLRDVGTDSGLRKALDELIEEGLINYENGLYTANQRSIEEAKKVVHQVREINEVYAAKFIASKIYFPFVAKYMLWFLKDEEIGVYRKFTDRCFFQRKIGKNPIRISSEEDIIELVEMHALDFFVRSSKYSITEISGNIPDTGFLLFDGERYFHWKPGRSYKFYRAPFSINHKNYQLSLPVSGFSKTPTVFDIRDENIESILQEPLEILKGHF